MELLSQLKMPILTNINILDKILNLMHTEVFHYLMIVTCICENNKHLKRIVYNSVIVCDEIINATDSVSTIVTNTITTNVASTISINSDDKRVSIK